MSPQAMPATSGNLAKGAAIGVLGEALSLPAGLITAAVLTRTLGLTHYGLLGVIYAAVAPWAWIAASVIGGRSAIVVISSSAAPRDAAGAVIRMSFVLGLVGWALFSACAPLLATGLHREEATGLLIAAGAEILLLPLARSHRDALTANGRYVGVGLAAAVQNMSRLIFVLSAAAAGFSVPGVISAVILSRLAEIVCCRLILSPPLSGPGSVSMRQLSRLASATFAYALCLQVFNRIDILMLTALGVGDAALSQFAAAQSVATAPGLIAIVIGPLLVADIRRSQGTRVRETGRRSDQVAAITAALCIALAGSAPSISGILFGQHFRDSAALLALLLVGAGGSVMQSFATAQMVASDRFRLPLVFGVSLLLIAVPGHLVAIPRWGALGAASVTAITAAVCGLAATAALPSPRLPRLVLVAQALGCGVVGFIVAHLLGELELPVLDGVAGVTAAVALMYLLGVIKLHEIRAVSSSLFRIGEEKSNGA